MREKLKQKINTAILEATKDLRETLEEPRNAMVFEHYAESLSNRIVEALEPQPKD